MDLDRNLAYWANGSGVDFGVAKDLVGLTRLLHALFFAHLSVEKMLKAHVVRTT